MRFAMMVMAIGLASLGSTPASAQMESDGEKFIAAVKKDDSPTALDLLRKHPTLVDTRDDKGDTALLVAVRRKDRGWTGELLNSGANVETAARNGDTPIIAAARVGFEEAVGWLVKLGAKVDSDNRMGETALIIAVQARDPRMTRTLLLAGADPDKTDHAGYSARDYAKRDTRSKQMLELIEAKKPQK